MSTATKIQWTDTSWNPVVGCSPVSEGCRHCYAAKEAIRLGSNPNPKIRAAYEGTSEMRGVGSARRAVFTGKLNLLPDRLEEPLHWRKPRRVFVNSMSDLFHEDVPFDFIDRVFAVMALCPQHAFQVLTKRPERMADYLLNAATQMRVALAAGKGDPHSAKFDVVLDGPWPLPNVWAGTSVEDQQRADERIPHLLRTPAAVRFLSCEPLLGPVDVWKTCSKYCPQCRGLQEAVQSDEGGFLIDCPCERLVGLHWIIVGGESGAGARPFNIAWAESLIEQCRAASVPCFVKQLGARPQYHSCRNEKCTHPDCGFLPIELKDRKGGDWSEWPQRLRVREFPQVAAI